MYESFLRYLRLFYDIPKTDEAFLTQALQPGNLRENEVLVRPGQVYQQMLFIGKGVLRIVGRQEDGTETTYYFCKENHLCPIIENFINQVPAVESLQAACPTELLVLPRPALLNLCAQLPYLQMTINLATRRRLLEKEQLRNKYMGKSAIARYQLFLECEPDIARRVSLRDIASYLNITQQSLSRIRRQLSS